MQGGGGGGGGWVLTPGGLFLVRSLVSDLEVTPADPVEEWNRVRHWCRKGEPGSGYLMDYSKLTGCILCQLLCPD